MGNLKIPFEWLKIQCILFFKIKNKQCHEKGILLPKKRKKKSKMDFTNKKKKKSQMDLQWLFTFNIELMSETVLELSHIYNISNRTIFFISVSDLLGIYYIVLFVSFFRPNSLKKGDNITFSHVLCYFFNLTSILKNL